MSLSLVTTAARQARALESVGHLPWPVPSWPSSVARALLAAVSCRWPVVPPALVGGAPALAQVAEPLDRLVCAPERVGG